MSEKLASLMASNIFFMRLSGLRVYPNPNKIKKKLNDAFICFLYVMLITFIIQSVTHIYLLEDFNITDETSNICNSGN